MPAPSTMGGRCAAAATAAAGSMGMAVATADGCGCSGSTCVCVRGCGAAAASSSSKKNPGGLPPRGGSEEVEAAAPAAIMGGCAATWWQCPTAVSWLLPLSLPVVIGVPKGRHHRLGVVAAVRLQESKAVKGASLHLQCGRCVAILRHTTMGKCRHMAAMMLCRHMAHGGILTWRHLILPPPCGGMCVVMAATMGRQRTAVTLAHCLKSSTAPRQIGQSHPSSASGVGYTAPPCSDRQPFTNCLTHVLCHPPGYCWRQ